jgi:hypothetical protein
VVGTGTPEETLFDSINGFLLTIYVGSFYLGTLWGILFEIIEALKPRKHPTKNQLSNNIKVLKPIKDLIANHRLKKNKLRQPNKNSNVKRASNNSKNGKTAAKKRGENNEKKWITKEAKKALHFSDFSDIAN